MKYIDDDERFNPIQGAFQGFLEEINYTSRRKWLFYI